MRRIVYKSSGEHSLLIIMLILLIAAILIFNITLSWFANNFYSRIQLIGDIPLGTQWMNGQTLEFSRDELYPGNTINRSLLIQKNSRYENMYIKLSAVVRIDGTATDQILFTLKSPQTGWAIGTHSTGNTYYSDYLTQLAIMGHSFPVLNMHFTISENLEQDKLDKRVIVILYIDLIEVGQSLSRWQNLPESWLQ